MTAVARKHPSPPRRSYGVFWLMEEWNRLDKQFLESWGEGVGADRGPKTVPFSVDKTETSVRRSSSHTNLKVRKLKKILTKVPWKRDNSQLFVLCNQTREELSISHERTTHPDNVTVSNVLAQRYHQSVPYRIFLCCVWMALREKEREKWGGGERLRGERRQSERVLEMQSFLCTTEVLRVSKWWG